MVSVFVHLSRTQMFAYLLQLVCRTGPLHLLNSTLTCGDQTRNSSRAFGGRKRVNAKLRNNSARQSLVSEVLLSAALFMPPQLPPPTTATSAPRITLAGKTRQVDAIRSLSLSLSERATGRLASRALNCVCNRFGNRVYVRLVSRFAQLCSLVHLFAPLAALLARLIDTKRVARAFTLRVA